MAKMRLLYISTAAVWAALSLSAQEMNPAGMYLMGLASGTSQNPASWDMPMLMPSFGN